MSYPYVLINIIWSMRNYSVKDKEDFMASNKIRFDNLDKRGNILSEQRLLKFKLIEKNPLFDEHAKSLMGALIVP